MNERQISSTKIPIEYLIVGTNKADIHSSVVRVEQSLTPPLSQPIPDPIINDKQTTNRISNEKNSIRLTYPSQFNTLTPVRIQLKSYFL